MPGPVYPASTPELSQRRRALAPEIDKAFREFSKAAFADGALPRKTKQLVAVAVAHTTQCPYCIRGHTLAALREGASEAEIMEAIWVAAEMRAGAAFSHAVIALEAMGEGHPHP
ncbi:carboxymuconolactone decarboxylase family protein [Anaeromyxobacter oryzisoli]|uniref:carboxymuconolactone decarboxylase family protein n=1 Tax=Anaeromyxobacter oryzisoli TaxID=2925408 RepID=UPI001F56C1C2|nr:carboxymuconolactone decarboxylase family protein [Anaeromyxobacter sp. SG63]